MCEWQAALVFAVSLWAGNRNRTLGPASRQEVPSFRWNPLKRRPNKLVGRSDGQIDKLAPHARQFDSARHAKVLAIPPQPHRKWSMVKRGDQQVEGTHTPSVSDLQNILFRVQVIVATTAQVRRHTAYPKALRKNGKSTTFLYHLIFTINFQTNSNIFKFFKRFPQVFFNV